MSKTTNIPYSFPRKIERVIIAPSFMSLFLTMRFNGEVLSSGTGFLVTCNNKFLLITNRHNVTGRSQHDDKVLSKFCATPNEIIISHNKKGALGQWIEKKEPLFIDDKPIWIEHPSLGKNADFVAIKLTDTDDIDFYPYNLDATEQDIAVGPAETVSVIGFPFGKSAEGFAIWATGFIATDLTLNYDEKPITIIDCRSRKGQSGSPVIAYRSSGSMNVVNGSIEINGPTRWRFIGIYSGRINDESDLGMVWKTSAIRELVNHIKKPDLDKRVNYSFRLK